MKKGGLIAGLLAAYAALSCAAYAAEKPDSPEDVATRSRPEYDPKGLPLGAFRLFLRLEGGIGSDSNVFRQESGTSDTFYFVAPQAELRSNWSRHALTLRAYSRSTFYSKEQDENTTDWGVEGAGQIDVLRSLRMDVHTSHKSFHEQRSSPDLPGFAKKPTEIDASAVSAQVIYQPNRLGVSFGGEFTALDYHSVPLIGGGTLNNDDRDRDILTGNVKAFYEFSPGYALFVRGAYETRDFSQKLDRSGFDRSSHGYRIDSGLDMMVSHLVRGQVFAGYLDQAYETPLPSVSGFDFGARLDWYATEKTTVRLDAAHTINDTTLAGASASDDRSFRAGVDHELLYNVILHAYGGYLVSTFDGISREDKYTSAGAGADYLISRYASLNISYDLQQRDSNVPGQDYDDHRFWISLLIHP